MTSPRDEATRPDVPREAPLSCTLEANDRTARAMHLMRALVAGIAAG